MKKSLILVRESIRYCLTLNGGGFLDFLPLDPVGAGFDLGFGFPFGGGGILFLFTDDYCD